MTNLPALAITSPQSQFQLTSMAAANEGLIDVVVRLSLDEVIECNGSDNFMQLLDARICDENCEIFLGYEHGVDYSVVGIDSLGRELLVRVQADIDPDFYEVEQ